MRQLASVQKIIDLKPIKGKDRIELATVLGYSVIVEKDLYEVGELVVYIEPDSILPQEPVFEFLRSRCFSKKWNGFRIRAMKMAGIVSYGIVFPINILGRGNWKEGTEVSKKLNIKKYDPESLIERKQINKKYKNPILNWLMKFYIVRRIVLGKKEKKESFPTNLVPKTDETRLQSVPFLIDEFKGTRCYISIKLDGQSATYIYYKKRFYICSRNFVVNGRDDNYNFIAKKYDIENKLKHLCKEYDVEGIAIQGEIVGPGVGNGSGCNLYELKELDFYVFNIYNCKKQFYLNLDNLKYITKKLELKLVPILEENYFLGADSLEKLIEKSKIKSKLNPKTPAEGIVIRDVENKYQPISKVGSTLSFKIINPDFMIKYKL